MIKKILVVLCLLLSVNAFASDEKLYGIIKHVEGFSPVCKPDNYQISGGYGSGFLCKNSKGKRQSGKKITVEMADAQLEKDVAMFRKELVAHLKQVNKKRSLKLYYTKNELDAILLVMYQKGWGNMVKNGFVDELVKYKLGVKSSKSIVSVFTRMSCFKNAKTKAVSYNSGLYKRHYATSQLFLNRVSSVDAFKEFQENSINDKQVANSTVAYCRR